MGISATKSKVGKPIPAIHVCAALGLLLGLFGGKGLNADTAHAHHDEGIPSTRAAHSAHQHGPLMTETVHTPGISSGQRFPTDGKGLPRAKPTEVINLNSGDVFDLKLAPTRKRIGGHWVRMLAYDGSVPGPVFRVPQGAEVTLRLHNLGDTETSLHTHGVRVQNAFDGVPGLTQKPQAIGETFDYRLQFPDPGIYWYHPHVRTDYAVASGLYGPVIVTPTDPAYWPPVNREIVLALGDVALDPSGERRPFFRAAVDHALMGRFGDTLLVNCESDYRFTAKRGETVRLYLANVANTRTFQLAMPGVRMKLIGADLGRYRKETWVDSVILAPGERRVVDVLFRKPGRYPLQHLTPGKTYRLGMVTVENRAVKRSHAGEFSRLRTVNPDTGAGTLDSFFEAEPRKYLNLTLKMDHAHSESGAASHHGFHQKPDGTLMNHAAMDGAQPGDGIEWEDTMATMNRAATSQTVLWKMVEGSSGKENMAIDSWNFTRGEKIKIRLFNDPHGPHPMQHPIHFHGQRFLVLATNGVSNANPAWQDTVLVALGATVDVLLDASNPGKWMAHCHILEHAESGMMLSFQVH
jgi:FtsP/CotA-like multicopper oxidase with cupredoxin domain